MDQPPIVALQKSRVANLWLLVSLLLSLLVLPLLEGLYAGRVLLLLGFTTTLIVAAVAARSRLKIVTLVLLVVALPTAWATLFVDSTMLFVTHCLLSSGFFWLVGGVIVFLAIKTHQVTVDSVFGAISAYLLFGLAWALSYWAIYAVSPGAYTFPEEGAAAVGADVRHIQGFSHFVYYSFVTMATLGYGDITPLSRITRTLSWMQTVTGQFYVAVVIAWLVSALPRPGTTRDAPDAQAN